MKTEVRNCDICGKPFLAHKINSKYCSDECQAEGLRRRTRANDRAKREREREERRARENSQKPLINIAVEAKKAGMSYGQYVAKMGL